MPLSKTWTNFGLLIILSSLLWGPLTDISKGGPAHVIGFMAFLLFFLDSIYKIPFFKQVWGDFLLLLAYAIGITLFIYIFYPYQEFRREIGYFFWDHKITAFLSASALFPAILCKWAVWLLDFKIASRWLDYPHHYPFVIGFYLFYSLMLLSIRFYKRSGGNHQAPMLYFLVAANLVIGILISGLAGLKVGALGFGSSRIAEGYIFPGDAGAVLAGISLSVLAYWYFPRLGIPLAVSSRRRQKQVSKIGRDIDKARAKLESYFEEINKA